MAIARLQLAVVVHGDKLYAIGGQDGDYATQKSVEVYAIDLFPNISTGVSCVNQRTCKDGGARAHFHQHLDHSTILPHLTRTLTPYHRYDFVTEQWTTLPTEMQVARSHHVAVVHQNKIYVVGGEDDEDVPLTSTECFDIATQEWSMLPTQMRMGRQNHCARCSCLSTPRNWGYTDEEGSAKPVRTGVSHGFFSTLMVACVGVCVCVCALCSL
jgi:hypothetical protein